MKELIEYIAKSLVNEPDQVVVTESTNGGRKIVNLKVAQADMGKVIGKQGRIAHAMRTLLKIASARSNSAPAILIIAGSNQDEPPDDDEDDRDSEDED